MPATYLGGVTIGGAVVGIDVGFGQVGGALLALKGSVDAAVTAIASAKAALDAQVTAIGAARLSIRIPAVLDLQAQLDASLAITLALQLQLTDPQLYLDGLLSGLLQVQLNISALLPSVAINGQIAAALDVQAMLALKIGAIDLQLDLLVAIALAISVQLTALLNIQLALSLALSLIVPALSAYASLTLSLGTAGAHVIRYDGVLSGLGAAVDGETPSTGLAGGDSTRAVVILIETSDAGRVAAFNAVLKVT